MRPGSAEKIRLLVATIPELERREQAINEQRETFETRDAPEFEEWMKSEFADERMVMEKIQREIEILQFAHAAAEGGFFGPTPKNPGMAFAKAEQEIRAEFERDDSLEAEGDEDRAEDDLPDDLIDDLLDSFLSEVRGLDPATLDPERYAQMREEFESTFDHMKSGNRPAFEKAILRLGADRSEDNQSESKSVFRRIVRDLHPDRQEEFGEVEKKLWNEAMLLHEALDAEGLRLIEIRLKLHRNEEISPSDTPLVRLYHQQLTVRIRSLEGVLADAAAHPAWEFSKKKGRKSHLRSLASGFLDFLEEAREHLAELMEDAMIYRRPASRKRSGGKHIDPMAILREALAKLAAESERSAQAKKAAKKQTSRKAAAKKVPVKKATAKKATAKKAPFKKAPARKVAVSAAPASPKGKRSTKTKPVFTQEEFPF